MYAWNSKGGKVMTGVTYHREILTNQGIGTGKTACGTKTDANCQTIPHHSWVACGKCFAGYTSASAELLRRASSKVAWSPETGWIN